MLTTRADGDARPVTLGGDAPSETLHKSIFDRPWSFVHQVHGRRVVAVRQGGHAGLEDADALVTEDTETPLCVLGADCALVGLSSDGGVVAAAHAGWRGLASGVIEATASAMRERGGGEISAVVSASVHPECYPFSPVDLDAVAAVFGDVVRARASSGEVALDLPRAVGLALARAGVEDVQEINSCTACGQDWFSHRGRGDRARQALVIWRERGGG
ncbi:MAG: polyphenol oxidase family protein [Acidimicrobiales bacterium]